MRIKLISHMSRLLTIPHNGNLVQVVPGENLIEADVLEAYAKSAQLKGMLFGGAIGGLEVVGVEEDGKVRKVDHEEALRMMFPESEIPSEAARVKTAARAQAQTGPTDLPGLPIEPGVKPEDSETDNASGELTPAKS